MSRACRAAARREGARGVRALAGQRIEAGRQGVASSLRTRDGSRRTRVIIATGYATPYFKPLAARFRLLNTYVVATRR